MRPLWGRDCFSHNNAKSIKKKKKKLLKQPCHSGERYRAMALLFFCFFYGEQIHLFFPCQLKSTLKRKNNNLLWADSSLLGKTPIHKGFRHTGKQIGSHKNFLPCKMAKNLPVLSIQFSFVIWETKMVDFS